VDLTAAEIEEILRGYAAGDAFGVAYEFSEFHGQVDPDLLKEKAGWPYGGVSDDTLLTLLTINSFRPESAKSSADNFLMQLRLSIPKLRGLGPTTRSALGLPVKDFEKSQVGISNGALMRTALLGLAFREHEAEERRHFVRALAEATHQSAIAINCAIIGSALFADARANGDKNSPFEIAERECRLLKADLPVVDWIEPICTGVSNESSETLNAVLWALKSSTSARQALQTSCELGGDTDTVAALTTALVIARKRGASDFASIPWIPEINWNEISCLSHSANFLHQLYDQEKVLS
jgi:ADP-ribosyl-[dinitrogen reductase] hydrolase